jgi:hypothetical protein
MVSLGITSNDCIMWICLYSSKDNKYAHASRTLSVMIDLGFMPRKCILLNNFNTSRGPKDFISIKKFQGFTRMENLGITNSDFIP